MSETSILISSVPRSLETKSKIFGLEISDVLLLFLNLSAENLVFGTTTLKVPMVWGTTLLLGALLFYVKRGKPDNYIQHMAQYLFAPSIRHACLNDRKYMKFSLSIKEGT